MMKKIPRVSIVTSDEKGSGLQGEISTLSVGLGLHRAWTYLALFCSTSLFVSPVLVSSSSYSVDIGFFYFICVVVTIAALLCIAAFSSRVRHLFHVKRTAYLAAAFCTFGSIIMLFGQLDAGLALPLSIVAGLICGISNATLIIFWGLSYSRFDVMTIVINTAISIALALVLFAILAFYIPHPWGAALSSILPLLELPFIKRHLYSKENKIADLPKPSYLPANKKSLALRLAIPLLLFGYALGVLRYFTVHTVNVNSDITAFLLALFSASIVMILLLVILYYYAESQSGESLARYMVPILICGMIFVVLPAFSGSMLASPLLMACYLCFKAIIWIFLCGTCSKFRLSPLFVIGLGFAAMAFGSLLSNFSLIANDSLVLISPFGEYTVLALAIIALVIAYALLPRTADIARYAASETSASSADRKQRVSPAREQTANVPHESHAGQMPAIPTAKPLVSGKAAQNAQTPYNSTEPPSVDGEQATASITQDNATDQESIDAFREKCDEISNRYLLSRREREVLYLLARGHNAAYIQDKLYVAQSTTKTHIYHIYKKLEIHSQQELIAMVMKELEE